jgi:hypothetical protein
MITAISIEMLDQHALMRRRTLGRDGPATAVFKGGSQAKPEAADFEQSFRSVRGLRGDREVRSKGDLHRFGAGQLNRS